MAVSLLATSTDTRARAAVSIYFLVFGTLVGSWLPHLPDVQSRLGLDYQSLGKALLCSGVGAMATMPFSGALIQRFGSRNLSLFGAIAACTGVPCLALERRLESLALNLLLVGLCYGVLDVAMNSHSVEVQARFQKPILSAIHGWFSFGGIVGGVGAAVSLRLSILPFVHLVITSAVLIVLGVLALPWMLPSEVDKGHPHSTRFKFPRGILLLLGLLCVAAFTAEGGVVEWSPVYIRRVLHAAPEFAGIMTAFGSAALTGARFLGDALIHRYGDRKVLIGSGAIMALFMVLAVVLPSALLAVLAFSLACLGTANMVPILFKQAGHVPGVSTGTGIASVTIFGYSAFLLGPPLIGGLANRTTLGFSLGCLALCGGFVSFGAMTALRLSPCRTD